MTINQITDHDARAKQLLLQQFKSKINVEKLTDLFAAKIQEIETVAFQLLNERALDNAVGQQLDGLGEILGEPRQGRGDAEYRAALGIRITINTAGGVPSTFIDVLLALTNGTHVDYTEHYPATVVAHSNGDTIPVNLVDNLMKVLPVTVELNLSVAGPSVTNAFTLDTPGSGLSAEGFTSEGELVAGF